MPATTGPSGRRPPHAAAPSLTLWSCGCRPMRRHHRCSTRPPPHCSRRHRRHRRRHHSHPCRAELVPTAHDRAPLALKPASHACAAAASGASLAPALRSPAPKTPAGAAAASASPPRGDSLQPDRRLGLDACVGVPGAGGSVTVGSAAGAAAVPGTAAGSLDGFLAPPR
eukprot:56472-Chlamydomonas_euryale.AAC.3